MPKIKKIIHKITAKLTWHSAVLGVLIAVWAMIGFAKPVSAGFFSNVTAEGMRIVFQYLTLSISSLLAILIQFAVYFLLQVANYDGFASAKAISVGWAVVRDLSNMVIVVGLLYIAFSTALGKGKYELDRQLVMLVLVAIGVNFSKTLTLFLVDISQVVMLTFVNAFSKIGVGNFAKILGINDFFQTSSDPDALTSEFVVVLAGLLFTVIIMLLVLAILVVLIAILIARVVAIWIFVVLSPAAILGYAIPFKAIESIKEKWWSNLTQYLLIGPCVAFFIWLTFASFQAATGVGANLILPNKETILELNDKVAVGKSLGKLGTPDKLAGFFVALAMLFGGIKVCSEMASGVAGVSSLKGIGDFTSKVAKKTFTAGNAFRLTRDATAGFARRGAALGGVISGAGVSLAGLPARRRERLQQQHDEAFAAGDLTRADQIKAQMERPGIIGRGIERAAKAGGGLSQLAGSTVGLAAGGLGRAARAGTYAEEFLKQPGTLAKGFYRRIVSGEKGAVGTALATTQENMFKSAQKEIETEGRSTEESEIIMDKIQKGLAPDLNDSQIVAEFMAAIDNNHLQKPEQRNDAWQKIFTAAQARGANMEFFVDQEKEWLKKYNKDKGSINTRPKHKMENGQVVDNLYAVERTMEQAGDRKPLDIWENYKSDEHDLSKEKFDNKDINFQNKKASMLGTNVNAVARNTDNASKIKFRADLEKLGKNATLTATEKNRLKDLIAATFVDGSDMAGKNSAQLEDAMERIRTTKEGEVGKSMNIAETAKTRTMAWESMPATNPAEIQAQEAMRKEEEKSVENIVDKVLQEEQDKRASERERAYKQVREVKLTIKEAIDENPDITDEQIKVLINEEPAFKDMAIGRKKLKEYILQVDPSRAGAGKGAAKAAAAPAVNELGINVSRQKELEAETAAPKVTVESEGGATPNLRQARDEARSARGLEEKLDSGLGLSAEEKEALTRYANENLSGEEREALIKKITSE